MYFAISIIVHEVASTINITEKLDFKHKRKRSREKRVLTAKNDGDKIRNTQKTIKINKNKNSKTNQSNINIKIQSFRNTLAKDEHLLRNIVIDS